MAKSIKQALIFVALLSLCPTPYASTDYALKDLDGKLHRVSDHRGKWLVMNFWATWCPPCVHEIPELESFYRKNRDIAEVWGITFEDSSVETIKAFLEQFNVSYPILGRGQDPKTGYGTVKVLPTTFIIDKEGKFFHRFEGPVTEHDLSEIIRSE